MTYNQPKVHYERIDHLVTQQNEAEARFLAQFDAGDYTIDAPLVVENPYLINPLAALVLFTTTNPARATVTVKGRDMTTDISGTFPETTRHILPVLGLYAARANRVVIELSTGESRELVIQGGELPPLTQKVQQIITTPEYLADNLMFVSAAAKSLPAGYDWKGDCRWTLAENFVFDMKRLKNGNLLCGSYRYSRVPYHATGVCEITRAGKIVKELAALVGGSGGGRPNMAQAGGREPGKIDEAIAAEPDDAAAAKLCRAHPPAAARGEQNGRELCDVREHEYGRRRAGRHRAVG